MIEAEKVPPLKNWKFKWVLKWLLVNFQCFKSIFIFFCVENWTFLLQKIIACFKDSFVLTNSTQSISHFRAEERPQQNFDLVESILEDDIFDTIRINFGDRVPLTISLQSHLANQTGQHMQLLAEKVAKVQQMQQVSAEYL